MSDDTARDTANADDAAPAPSSRFVRARADYRRARQAFVDASEELARGGAASAAPGTAAPSDRGSGDTGDPQDDNDDDRDAKASKDADSADDTPADDDRDKDKNKNKNKGQGKDNAGKRPGKLPLIILAVVIVLAIIGALVYWLMHRNEESTDDAFTDGDAVVIAPKVSGYVSELDVNDNARVKKGDVLLRIDAADFNTTRDQARAQLGLAEANLRDAEAQLAVARVQAPAQLAQAMALRATAEAGLAKASATAARQHDVDARATSQEAIDAADAQKRSAEAEVERAQAQVKSASVVPEQLKQVLALIEQRRQQVGQAQAQVAQSDLSVGYTTIVAPADGWVTKRNVELGSFLQAGTQVMTLVTPQVWITANFKESQLERMRVGDAVRVKVDAYPQLDLHGHVDSIQLGTGSRFSAFPAENATGNFVKIVQRVPVKIVVDSGFDPNRPLALGLSATPTVELR